jgi:hypothetical protein
VDSGDINNAQGPQGAQGNQANVVQSSRGQGSRQVDARGNVGGPTVRVNVIIMYLKFNFNDEGL